MAALPPVDAVVRTAVEGTISGSAYANIFHWSYDSTGELTNANCNQLAEFVLTGYGTLLTAGFPDYVVASNCEVTDLSSASAGVGSYSGTFPGGGPSTAVPASACTLVKHYIARRYRGGHPRTYLPPQVESAMSDPHNWGPTYTASIQTAWDAFTHGVMNAETTGFEITGLVNVSYYSGHVLRPTPVVDVITGSSVEGPIATQRRRLGR
jgi:hypothetical protein